MPWDADAARRRSRAELAKYGIDVLPPHFPLLFEPDELARLRPADDAIARAVALYAVIAVREGAPAEMGGARAAADRILRPVAGQLVPGAIQERRHGLQWLFAERDLDWEEVDLSI